MRGRATRREAMALIGGALAASVTLPWMPASDEVPIVIVDGWVLSPSDLA